MTPQEMYDQGRFDAIKDMFIVVLTIAWAVRTWWWVSTLSGWRKRTDETLLNHERRVHGLESWAWKEKEG